MNVRLIVTVLLVFVSGVLILFSQTFMQPNYALKSHETMSIRKVEITGESTIVSLSVENRITGGNFCADRNIYIIDPSGVKYKVVKAVGIPVCPDSYAFKSIGEVLNFTLEFPPVSRDIKWVDIIEDCTSNCFRFYGVTLDNELNKKLDEVFTLSAKGKPAENMILFSRILDDIGSQNLGIEGLLYINIISAAVEDSDNVNAKVWYKRLAASKAPRVEEYLKFLNDKGVKY
jgi:hypothetical protein